MFLRGKNNGRVDGNQDPDGDRTLGNLQLDKTRIPRNTGFTTDNPGNHSHGITTNEQGQLAASSPYGVNGTASLLGTRSTNGSGSHSHSVTGGGDNESTPRNLAINIFIKIN
jgi:hypothetical protein